MKRKLSLARWLRLAAIAVVLLAVVFVAACNYRILSSSKGRVFTDASTLPINDVGLVLGSNPRARGGEVSPHFQARIKAAAYLFQSGRVKHLLLSGDNGAKNYDEPADMRSTLLALGVPDQCITLDYAGFRTLDSVARAHEVFGLTRMTIITEDFHLYRALFLADHFGVDAVGYSAGDIPLRDDPEPRIREIGARVKAVLDVYVLNRQPRFTGPKIEIKV